MTSILHIDQGPVSQGSLHLPFEELITLLKRDGFVIKPDDYIELLKVVRAFGHQNILALKYRIAPLIAASEAEQNRFYTVFDAYAKGSIENDGSLIKDKKRRRWIIIYSVIAALALVACLIFLLSRITVSPGAEADLQVLVNGQEAGIAIPGDSVMVDATPILKAAGYDSSRMHMGWQIGKEWTYTDQPVIKLSTLPLGNLAISFRLQQKGVDKKTIRSATQTIGVYRAIIEQLKAEGLSELKVGDRLRVAPVIRGDQTVGSGAKWVVNEKDTISDQTGSLLYTIDSAGAYTINYLPKGSDRIYAMFTPVDFFVAKDAGLSTLEMGSIGKPVQPDKTIHPLAYLFFLVPVLGVLVTYLLHRRAIAKAHSRHREWGSGPSRSLNPPMDVPLKNNDLQLVAREPQMNLLFRGLRRKIEDDCQELNIRKSIRSEIMAGGMPTLVFTRRMKQQEFLILVDRTKIAGQQLHLFEYLIRVFLEEDIQIEKFYFSGFDRFYNGEFPEGISLQRLSELYKSQALVIFGNGYQLLYPHLPALEKDIKNRLEEWEIRTLVTPLAYGDWGQKEAALKKTFLVCPADIQGLVSLVQAVSEKQFDAGSSLQALNEIDATGSWNLDYVDQVRSYLGNDLLFQWLCGVAVYPKLRWEMIIEIGKAITQSAGQEGLLNFSSLLQLVRIPWMQEGAIPEHTRLALLKHLSVDNELIARETILRVLQQPGPLDAGDYFFHQEKNLQELTSQFVLYQHDPQKYGHFQGAFETFKTRWQEGKIYDGTMKRYLDKREGDHWETPLTGAGSEGMDKLFNDHRSVEVKKIARPFRIAYAAMALVAVILGGLFFVGKPVLENKKFGGIALVQVDSSQSHLLRFHFLLDSCVTDTNVFVKGMQGNIDLNGTSYPLQFASWNSASVSAPYRDIAASRGIIALSWGTQQQTANKEIALSATSELIIKACSDPGFRPQLFVRYNDPLKQDSVQLLADLFADQFTVRLVLDPGDTRGSFFNYYGSRVESARNLLQWVSKQFSQVVSFTVDSTLRDSLPASTLVLNFPKTDQWALLPLSNLPASLSEIWKETTNSRLLTIDVADRLIWYSTGEPKTYGTYRIEEAGRKDDLIRLIVSGNGQYRVLFLQNVQPGSMQVCLLPSFVQSIEEARAFAITACDNMASMRAYYSSAQSSASNFYFPLRPGLSLNASESGRLSNRVMGELDKTISGINYHRNAFFNPQKGLQANPDTRINAVKKLVETKISGGLAGNKDAVFEGSPFDRDFITIDMTRSANENSPAQTDYNPLTNQANAPNPCAITYTNLTEALNQSRKVCRLNLSNQGLSAIDEKSLAQLGSLTYLDVRYNNLPLRDSLRLVQLLPKCQILFSPQNAPREENWKLFTQLFLDTKHQPMMDAESDWKNVYATLKGVTGARIKIVGYYQNASAQKDAQNAVSNVLNYISKKYGIDNSLGPDKVISEIQLQSKDQDIKITMKIKTTGSPKQVSKGEYVNVFGVNLESPKKY